MISPRFVGLLLAALLCLSSGARAQRLVFAHYMLVNQDYQGDEDPTQERKIAAYQREIQQAQALGIDGFALNAGGWLREPYYVRYAGQMFEAATRLHTGFKLVFSADLCCGNRVEDLEDMMRRFANNPRYASVYFRYQGKFVLTTFAGQKQGPAFWQQVRSDLATGANPSTATFANDLPTISAAPSNAPMQIFLVPAFFWGGELPDRAAVQQGMDEWKSIVDGSFYWGIAGVPGLGYTPDQIPPSEAYASVDHGAGKLYMAPVALQFWGANADRYYEYSGGLGMRRLWMNAINTTHPDWVEIITWNDFIEGTYISPIDDPNRYPGANFLNGTGVPLNTVGYFHSHAAAGQLMSFFIQWYKTGKQPPIAEDTIFWFYRTQSWKTDSVKPSVAHKYGPVADAIYITANLRAPATLIVRCGARSRSLDLKSGTQDVAVPFVVGATPRFELRRNGRPVLQGAGADPIERDPKFNNFYYSSGELSSRTSPS